MRILWVKAGGLVPPDTGGKIRSYNILQELAHHHTITLFAFYASHPGDQHHSLSQIVDKLVCVPLELPEPKSSGELADYARTFFSLDSYSLMKYCRPEARRRLVSLLREQTFDVILCDFLFPAPIIPWAHPCPKVIFTHNVEAIIWKRHYEVARNPLWKLLSWREWKTMERAERRYLRQAAHVLAVSGTDADAFRQFVDPSRITVIPTGVDIDFFQPRKAEVTPNSLVFTGSMDWLPNEDGIFYFVERILPLIRREIPDVSLTVVGRKPSERLQRFADAQANLYLTGWVDDVRPHLANGSIFVVPLRIGGGTRLKIFEAMAAGKPVISTTIGAEGLPVKHGENILLADTPEDFAGQTVALLRDPVRRDRIGAAAHKMVVESYSWAAVARRFGEVLERVRVAHS
jgi:sugar transferase (PEP-CTERM/EpsH1 system associated)